MTRAHLLVATVMLVALLGSASIIASRAETPVVEPPSANASVAAKPSVTGDGGFIDVFERAALAGQ